jgi:putative spermidine/putrescine transport system substrate-binding protein
MRPRLVVSLIALLTVCLPISEAHAQNALVVSIWGGNWKNTVESVIGKAFTAKTGIPVEYEVGGTIDRLAKARVAKGSPLVDLNFTTTHVARLYMSDGLYAKLDMAKIPNAKEIAREAIRSDYHLGTWAYVYTVVYRRPREGRDHEVVGPWPLFHGQDRHADSTLASHHRRLMEGGNEVNWQKGEAASQLWSPSPPSSPPMPRAMTCEDGQAPVQVMLSVNAYHLQEGTR